MKMNNILSSIRNAAIAFLIPVMGVAALASCDDQLDITPKGKVTLSKVEELEYLMNQEFNLRISPGDDLGVICNEGYGSLTYVSDIMGQPGTYKYALYAYDETVDRAALTTEDNRYNEIYKYINYANVVISKVSGASGPEEKKTQINAEAHILRAYLHWLLVNVYAKQYDEATAAKDGGIAYVTSTDVSAQKTKISVADVYSMILADCSDEYIAKVQKYVDNVNRVDQAFANGVRAKVLMQMKRYAEALPYAEAALACNKTIEDRSVVATTKAWNISQSSKNNYVWMGGGIRIYPSNENLSLETVALFEENDFVLKYDNNGWNKDESKKYTGIDGTMEYAGMKVCTNPWGITAERMYYTAAECLIRTGNAKKGLEYVDLIRAKRVEDYVPYAADGLSEEQAMALMQKAKWVECVSSYENFFDCKRWNTEAKYRRTITRDMGTYGKKSISPDSPLWVFPFPANAVIYNSSLTQNF